MIIKRFLGIKVYNIRIKVFKENGRENKIKKEEQNKNLNLTKELNHELYKNGGFQIAVVESTEYTSKSNIRVLF